MDRIRSFFNKNEVLKLLHDDLHEVRLLALIIINQQFTAGDEVAKKS